MMSEAFAGRLNAYATSLDHDDRDALAAALERNLLRGTGAADAALLTFVIDLDRNVQALADDVILAGHLE
jgi:hypothetical protein